MADAPVRFVSAEATESVLDWKETIARLRDAYSMPLKEENSPPRALARGDGVWLRSLVAIPPSSRYMGTKGFGLARGRRVNYLITLYDQESGSIAALVDGYHITALRTAATSAVALDRLAPRGRALSVAVLGSGTEARTHVKAFAAIREISALRVYSPTAAKREQYAADCASEFKVPCTPVAEPRAAVDGAEIVIAAARSRDETPILYGGWLEADAVVCSIGSTLKEQREIDFTVVEACDLIVCDHVHEVVHETGDMIAASAAGVAFGSKLASLNEILSGAAEARLSAARRPMFKSVGSAIQDVVVAELALERATQRGLAVELPVQFRAKQV